MLHFFELRDVSQLDLVDLQNWLVRYGKGFSWADTEAMTFLTLIRNCEAVQRLMGLEEEARKQAAATKTKGKK